MNEPVNERDRVNTEARMMHALEKVILEEGFDKVGINNVSAKAGVSKVLIYRYFGSLDNMLVEYLARNEFWNCFLVNFPTSNNVKEYIKGIFRDQIYLLRSNAILRKLFLWELSSANNKVIEKFRLKREAKGVTLSTLITQLSESSQEEVASLVSVLTASISYLLLLSDNCMTYNGLDIQTDEGWKLIEQCINRIIDLWYDNRVI